MFRAIRIQAFATVRSEFILAPFIRMALFISSPDSGAIALRRQLHLVTKIVLRFMPMCLLAGGYILFFAWAGMILFAGTDQAQSVQPDGSTFAWPFSDYSSATWALHVLFTQSNTPDVLMPAYNLQRLSVVYFAVFILVGCCFFANLLLAIVYRCVRVHVCVCMCACACV